MKVEALQDTDNARLLRSFLIQEGYRACDIPACNCGGYHNSHAQQRLDEIAGVLRDAGLYPKGNTILDAVKALAESAQWLACLESAGVDNWEGISEAQEIQRHS